MEKKDFYRLEDECEFRFRELGTCWHLCTDENSPVIFHNETEFKVAMNIIALVSILFQDIVVLTFEVMSNHLHFALCGERERIVLWFCKLVSILKMHPELEGSKENIATLKEKIIPVESLENARNVIAYINRNGFIVDYNHTPYSYLWGANRYFFNEEAKSRYEVLKVKTSTRSRRQLFHSNLAESISGIYLLDGYVSPMCFCDLVKAESLFRNAQHYFSKIAKSVESSAAIAREIGESLYYLDSELYSIIAMKCSKEYGINKPALIAPEAKIAIAKQMRFEYNASAKQISRILRIEMDTVQRLFPKI